MLVSLAHARESGHPVLTPGDLAFWDVDNTFAPVTVLGYGEYLSAYGRRVDGVTIKINAEVKSAAYGLIKRGERMVVSPDKVVPRGIVTTHPNSKYRYVNGSWAFDLRCRVHGVEHSTPSRVCRFNRAETALIDEVTDAREAGRPISHAAARMIAAFYVSDAHPFVRTGAIAGADPYWVWNGIVGVMREEEPAAWRIEAQNALRDYFNAAVMPRDAVPNWTAFRLFDLDADARYSITREYNGASTPRWTARFCLEEWIGVDHDRHAVRRLAVRHYNSHHNAELHDKPRPGMTV